MSTVQFSVFRGPPVAGRVGLRDFVQMPTTGFLDRFQLEKLYSTIARIAYTYLFVIRRRRALR